MVLIFEYNLSITLKNHLFPDMFNFRLCLDVNNSLLKFFQAF
jgi:hypothetical protein